MKFALSIAAVVLSLAGVSLAQADDGNLTTEELFKKLDVNGDGKLTAAEIPKEHQKYFERLLRLGHKEKEGELTRAEFDAAMGHKEEPVTDLSKVGNLGAGPGQAPKIDPKRIFQALDKDQDGKLTREEAKGRPRILALFDQLGKDELTLDDLTSLGGTPKPKAKKAKKAAARLAKMKMEKGEGTGSDEEMNGPPLHSQNHGLTGMFRLLDTNHDGRLSQEELAKASALFEKLDRNHDGFIDAQELANPPRLEEAESNPMPRLNGKKGKRMAGAGMRRGQNMLQMIMRADQDGDGKISQEEAPPQLKKHFARLDTNGDGFLDRSEIDAWVTLRQKRIGALRGDGTPSESNANP